MDHIRKLASLFVISSLFTEVSSMDSAMIGIIASSSCAGLLFIVIVIVAIIAAAWNDCYYDYYMSKRKRLGNYLHGSSRGGSDVISLHRVRPTIPYTWMENSYPPPPGMHVVYPDENVEHEFYVNAGGIPHHRYGEHPSPGVLVTEVEEDSSRRAQHRASGSNYQTPRNSQSMNTLQRESQSMTNLHRDNQSMNTLQRENQSANTLQRDNQPTNTLQRETQSMNTLNNISTTNLSHAHSTHSDLNMNQNVGGYPADTLDRATEDREKVTSF